MTVLMCLLGCVAVQAQTAAPTGNERLFANRIWPLLNDKCLACHGNDQEKIKGAFDLRSLDGALRGGESGKPALVRGEPGESPLWVAVTWQDEDLQMPPKENDRLTAEQIGWIREWIAAGAAWPEEKRRVEIAGAEAAKWASEDGIPVRTSGGLSAEWTGRRYKPENLWAYQPLKKPALPPAAREATSGNAIDAFINERLEKGGVQPARRADRRTLIRRATYDLLGLPPTPQDVDEFVNDPDSEAEAFVKVVERLLASPHYGERFGRHWLDVVRYADSSGFANDYERGNAWRYRDYVIRSFNEDKPYDQFVREQIAGDEIDPDDPEKLVAVGFLRMGPWELTGMEVPKVARQRFLDDVTDSVGQAFLAHPLQCARCHDHKFDPVPTRDYYALQAIFGTTQLAERKAPFLSEENTEGFDERKYLEQRKERYQEMIRKIDAKEAAAARKWCVERGLEYVPREEGRKRGLLEEKLPPRHVGLSSQDLGLERIARKGLERLRWELERYEPYAFSVYSGLSPRLNAVYSPLRMPENATEKGELEKTAILAGGDPFSPAASVEPAVLSAVSSIAGVGAEIPDSIAGRRLALANWIAHPENPLTARVMVNRIWQWHFGRGLAGNPNNFGATGQKPEYPDLLDWLAATFVERGWSMKAMHRLIMSSDAYCRAGAVVQEGPAPGNAGGGLAESPAPARAAQAEAAFADYGDFKPRPLSAEELRDSMLAVSGEWNRQIGGIPARPEINMEAALQPRQVMGTFAAPWQPSPKAEQRHRRSVYALRIRGLRDPFMEVFNEPSPDLSCERRETSTITPQVFSLFNSQASYDRAVAFAARLIEETGLRERAIQRAFHLTFGREAKGAELRACLEHWDRMTARHRHLKLEPAEYPREVVREAVEENTGEKFTFVETLEFYHDFQPDLSMADVDATTRGLAEVCLVLFNSNEFAYVY